MLVPGLKWGERLVRESPDIVIGENQFTLYLTNRRLLFWHAAKRKSFWIDRNDLRDVEFFQTESGEPLFVISFRGKKKGKSNDGTEKAIIVFSERSGPPRGDEAEMLFSYIHAIARQNLRISEGSARKKRRVSGDFLPDGQHCSCGKKFLEGTVFCTFCGKKIVLPGKKDRNAFSLFSLGSTKKKVAIPDDPAPPEDEVSMAQVPCRTCLELIPDNSVFCKYCGARQAVPKKPDNKPGFSLGRLFKARNNKI